MKDKIKHNAQIPLLPAVWDEPKGFDASTEHENMNALSTNIKENREVQLLIFLLGGKRRMNADNILNTHKAENWTCRLNLSIVSRLKLDVTNPLQTQESAAIKSSLAQIQIANPHLKYPVPKKDLQLVQTCIDCSSWSSYKKGAVSRK